VLEELRAQLNAYYSDHRIHPRDSFEAFECKHKQECRGTSDRFVSARMPGIGVRYLESGTPRLVVISLDPGAEKQDAHREIRLQTSANFDKGADRNRHWYQTHEMVATVLSRFDPDLTPAMATEHFAHVNSAKCCLNLPGHKQAPLRVFMNCRWYLPGEIRVLKPQIILTQGDRARNALRGGFAVLRDPTPEACGQDGHKCWARVIALSADYRALWLHTYHPNQKGGLYRHSLEGYRQCYPNLAWQFVNGA